MIRDLCKDVDRSFSCTWREIESLDNWLHLKMSILECVGRGCAQERNSKTLYVYVSFLGQQVGSIREAGHLVLWALICLLSHADPSIFKKPQSFVTTLL